MCGLLVLGTLLDQAGIGGDDGVVDRLATVTVVFTLFIYALVIVSALKLRGHDEDEDTFLASTPLLWLGIVGNLVLLVYVVYDDPASLLWCAGLLALGGLLFVAEYFLGTRDRAPGAERGTPASTDSKEI